MKIVVPMYRKTMTTLFRYQTVDYPVAVNRYFLGRTVGKYIKPNSGPAATADIIQNGTTP